VRYQWLLHDDRGLDLGGYRIAIVVLLGLDPASLLLKELSRLRYEQLDLIFI
jgi:hypothetical protein